MAQKVAKFLDGFQLSDTEILLEAEGKSLSEVWKSVSKVGHIHPGGGDGTGGGSSAVFVGQWVFLRQNHLPAGYLELNGTLYTGAAAKFPDLMPYLSTHTDECTTEADWQARSAAASGTGGVPFYVLDTTANTLRMPDTRGDSPYHGTPGTWQGDAIRNVTGVVGRPFTYDTNYPNGPFHIPVAGGGGGATGWNIGKVHMDLSLAVPTDTTNHPRRVALTWAVYAGTIGA